MTPNDQPLMPDAPSIRPGESFHCSAVRPEEQFSEAVVRTVATAMGDEPTTLDPLYESVNPDALDALFRPDSHTARADNTVQFDYAGFTVVVRETGTIELR
ncbi:HalOD1 output domain-containing protein [Haladaptatus sp. NG-WS-4]